MAKTYVLYNKNAGSTNVETLKDQLKGTSGELSLIDITVVNYRELIPAMEDGDVLLIAGGDGTLNRFVNDVKELEIKNEILYYPSGSGNDFARELGKTAEDGAFAINKYIEKLPTVCIDEKESYFINGIGYGIDGYCCEVGDKLRATSDKPVNYTEIAIKGLLFHYKPTNARVTVDGKTTEYKKVWIAPTMNGKFYGGGMMPTPLQDRSAESGELSVMIFHDTGKLKTLMIFPSLFKGEHVKKEKYVTVLTGTEITVEFDEPRTVQIDGETVFNVSSYTARSHVLAAKKEEAAKV